MFGIDKEVVNQFIRQKVEEVGVFFIVLVSPIPFALIGLFLINWVKTLDLKSLYSFILDFAFYYLMAFLLMLIIGVWFYFNFKRAKWVVNRKNILNEAINTFDSQKSKHRCYKCSSKKPTIDLADKDVLFYNSETFWRTSFCLQCLNKENKMDR